MGRPQKVRYQILVASLLSFLTQLIFTLTVQLGRLALAPAQDFAPTLGAFFAFGVAVAWAIGLANRQTWARAVVFLPSLIFAAAGHLVAATIMFYVYNALLA